MPHQGSIQFIKTVLFLVINQKKEDRKTWPSFYLVYPLRSFPILKVRKMAHYFQTAFSKDCSKTGCLTFKQICLLIYIYHVLSRNARLCFIHVDVQFYFFLL